MIHNAASEPHVQDLARLLMQMGARVEGIGSNVMIVHGSESLGGADYTIGADYIEVGELRGAGRGHRRRAAREGRGARGPAHDPLVFERLGCTIEFDGNDLVVPADQQLRIRNDAGDAMSKVEDGPWPAFPADLTSIALALATQSDGMVLIHEKMFENRLFFVDKLINMGARVILCDPHRAVVAARGVFTVSAWRAPTSGPAWRCSSPRSAPRARPRSATSARSTAATSGSTSACGRWARASSASRRSPCLRRQLRQEAAT